MLQVGTKWVNLCPTAHMALSIPEEQEEEEEEGWKVGGLLTLLAGEDDSSGGDNISDGNKLVPSIIALLRSTDGGKGRDEDASGVGVIHLSQKSSSSSSTSAEMAVILESKLVAADLLACMAVQSHGDGARLLALLQKGRLACSCI
jgi:hypothetical protein